jgi:transposase InsO family protein
VARFKTGGLAALHDRSSRPHSMPTRTTAEIEAAVVTARLEHRRGQDWLGPELGVPARTCLGSCDVTTLPRLCELDPLTGTVIRASKTTAVRYERSRPGELVHMDVKKFGKIPDGGGWRAHGRSEQVRGRGIGYDYVHSAVDDHSRLAYSEVLPDETSATCAAFLGRAAAYFAERGVIIERLLTDNALAYRKSTAFREACVALGIKQKFIKPHCPWQNGKVERFNRTLQVEWAYRHVFTSSAERAAALAPWIENYNTRRRHSALKGLPPISRL